jgi:hypothetical protein
MEAVGKHIKLFQNGLMMAIPINLTWETAIEIKLSNCPFITTQNVHDAGTTYVVWYKIVNDLGRDAAIVTWFYGIIPGNSSVYSPDYNVIVDPDGLNEEYIIDAYPNCATEFPIKAGVTYYVDVRNYYTANPNVTPAILNINVSVVPSSNIFPAGLVFIPAASNDYGYFSSQGGIHAGLIDPTTGIIVNTIPFFITSEGGDILKTNGRFLFTDNADNLHPSAPPDTWSLGLYSPAFELVTRIDVLAGATTFEPLVRANNGTNKFWIAISGYSGEPNRYASIDSDGILSTTKILTAISPVATLSAIAATNNESHLLVIFNHSINNQIKRWNLNTLVWDTDLTTSPGTVYRAGDLLVMFDDSIIVTYLNTTNDLTILLKRYNSIGTELNSYTITNTIRLTSNPRLGYALDENYFWFWAPREDGTSLLKKIKWSDGSVIIDQITYNVYQTAIETMTPALRYTSDSCPVIETYVDGSGSNGGGNGGNGNGGTEPPISTDVSGIYFINPAKTTKHDSYYGDIERKIPNPTIKTALVGE